MHTSSLLPDFQASDPFATASVDVSPRPVAALLRWAA
jgi:hypothetical protein